MSLKYFFGHVVPYKTLLFFFILWLSFKYGFLNTIFIAENDPEMTLAIKIGVVTSLIGSSIFLMLLAILKPSFAISKNIALSPSNHYPGQESYTFKVINKSWFFHANEVNIRVTYLRDYSSHPTRDKRNLIREELKVIKPRLSFIPRRLNMGYLKTDPHCEQCGVLKTADSNITQLLNGSGVIEIEVIAKHSLSGFTGMSKKRYFNSQSIKKGTFEPGDTFNILPINNNGD